jgi:PKD repeat protein
LNWYLAILMVVSLSYSHLCLGQKILYQEVFYGGVTGAGYNPNWTSNAPGVIRIYIEPGSTIRKSFLLVGVYGNPNMRTIQFNNHLFEVDSTISVSTKFIQQTQISTYHLSTGVIDITDFISINDTVINIIPPVFQPSISLGNRFVEYYVFVAYENPLLAKTNALIILNEQDNSITVNYAIDSINAMNLNYDVGFAVQTSSICDTIVDGSYVAVDGTTIGLIGGSDENSFPVCAGVTGSFYYQNNTLFGLSDDSANNSMSGTDAIANVKDYLNSIDEIYIDFEYQNPNQPNPNAHLSNSIWQLYFAYSTPCQPFETTLSEEVAVCRGANSQLLATGGQSYEWLPQEDLSCYDCPNPVFLGDRTRHYTVRIWSTDSCSKVLPVKVLVYDVPTQANLNLNPATCSESNGSLSISNVVGGTPQYIYNIGGNDSTNPNFNNLAPGVYNLQITDANTCIYNQPFTIEEINPVTAAFNANPQQGVAPLNVNFTNQSTGANLYQWLVNTQTFESINLNYTFDTAGTYPVQLIAFYSEPQCADTALKIVVVENDFSVIIPTLFHSSQGTWGITTSNVVQIKAQVYNAIGQLIHQSQQTANNGPNPIWRVNENATGYYFYRLQLTDVEGKEHGHEGKVLVVR